MMPEKKKMLIVGLIAMIALAVLVFVVYLITRMARATEIIPLTSDNYPSEVVYLGIYYDEENEHDIIYPLNKDFERLDYSLNSFYPIKAYTKIKNRLVIYSDTVNEIGFSNEENRFFLNEINPYFNQNVSVKLTTDYLLLIEDEEIIARPYTADNNEHDQIIAKDILSDYVETIGNIVYFSTSKGIESYDLTNNTSQIIITPNDEAEFNPILLNVTGNMLLFEVEGIEWVYSTVSKRLLTLNQYIKEPYNNFALYEDGIIYYLEESDYFMSENISRNVVNGFVKLTNTIDKVYHVFDAYLYMEQTTSNDEKSYIIYNAENMNTIATLDYPYTDIIRVAP